MLSYILRRLAYMVVILILVSIVCFYIINLPPGSFIETFATQLDAAGSPASQAQLDYLTTRYGLDQPLHVQYWNWIVPLVRGDYGFSFGGSSRSGPSSPTGCGSHRRVALLVLFVYAVSIPWPSTRPRTSIRWRLHLQPAPASSAWPCRTSSWRWCCSWPPRLFGVTPTGPSRPNTSPPVELGQMMDLMVHLPVPVIVVGLAAPPRPSASCARNCSTSSEAVRHHRPRQGVPRAAAAQIPFRVALNPIISTAGRSCPTSSPARPSSPSCWPAPSALCSSAPSSRRTPVAAAASCCWASSPSSAWSCPTSCSLLDPRVRMSQAN